MLDWLLYLFFGVVNPSCQADTVHDLAQCDSTITVQGGGGGADPIDPDKDKDTDNN